MQAQETQGTSSESESLVEPAYKERTLEEVELDHIAKTLKYTQGQKNRAASILGIERSTLDRKLKRLQDGL
jgi:Nif-specific regulatory protein